MTPFVGVDHADSDTFDPSMFDASTPDAVCRDILSTFPYAAHKVLS
ncbi:hypothetical protein [Mycolicibacterium peregrinum]